MEIIEGLNELLEAERAGVETLSRLIERAPTPEMRKLFEGMRDDEAWSCAGLANAIRRLGGAMSEKKGDFAEKVMAEGSLRDRLRLLNRGQGWVVKRLDEALERELDGESRAFLGAMRAVHRKNIDRCEGLLAELDAPEVLDVRAMTPRERHPKIFETFDRLPAGEAFILMNDHDPKPLYYQFSFERAGAFRWRYLEEGPDVWRIEIGKT
jgi:uncharacterized protein (DUF2249 family)